MRFIFLIGFAVLFSISLFGLNPEQGSDSIHKSSRSYSFVIQDSPASLFTMRQSNQNFLSLFRYSSDLLYQKVSIKTASLIQYFVDFLFLLPLTHEEGHRSILTSLGIGAISQPYFNSKGAAYVKGVRDLDLINLKQTDFSNYIRLHTAGLESDYMLSNRIEEMVFFNYDSKQHLQIDYISRKLSLLSYYTLSLIPGLSPKLKEEINELDRDIVGHDVYGAIKNLHRPHISFYRYTNYDDLTDDDRRFVKRVGSRALLNLVSPMFLKPLNLIKKSNLQLSISAGYTMCPFGDFIDENCWVVYKQRFNIHAYLRQFENRATWFLAGGIRLVDYQISSKFKTTIATHFWNQPKNLDFNTSNGQFGGSGDFVIKYAPFRSKTGNSMSIDLGLIYKTKGFLPEEVFLKEHFGMRIGTTLNLKQR